MIASHYAQPLPRVLARDAALHAGESETSETICELNAGDAFEMLDNRLGWAWGYGGSDRRVGYLRSDALETAG